MKYIFLLIILIVLTNCTKPQTVLICGNHVCVNKAEAEQYFEENLSIEVKIVNKSNKEKSDLVELNLRDNNKNHKQISIISKKNTNEKLKELSKSEINQIKKNVIVKKKEKKLVRKPPKKNNHSSKINVNSKSSSKSKSKSSKIDSNKIEINKGTVNKNLNDIVDVCTILKKCSIDEISKYLLKQGMDKDFPDITKRQ